MSMRALSCRMRVYFALGVRGRFSIESAQLFGRQMHGGMQCKTTLQVTFLVSQVADAARVLVSRLRKCDHFQF